MTDDHASDERWFRQVFEATYADLVAYARRRVGSPVEADDVVAEVYATAWRRRADADRSVPARPWLYGIAANVVRNQRRSGSRRLRLVDRLERQPTPSPQADPAEQSGAELRGALSRLSPDDQEVLRLVAWEGLSHDQAGQALGCSENAVGIRVHRARQRLRAELGQLEPVITTESVAKAAGSKRRPTTEDGERDRGDAAT